MQLRSAKVTSRKEMNHAANGNLNNSAETALSQIGNGDSEHIGEEEDVMEDDDDELVVDEEESSLLEPPESGQGDAKNVDQSCSNCLETLLRYLGYVILNLVIFLVVFLVVLMPLSIKLYPEIPKHIIYLNAYPTSVALNYTRNFYHHVEEDINVGVWHSLPKSLEREGLKTEDFDELLSAGPSIMLYCHGNTGTRGQDHRVDMYKVLAAQGYHVIALDYRGYGDSTGSPTSENGVMTDVVSLYLWIRKKAGPDVPIYVWGHSLGTGIATKAVRFLTQQKKEFPRGLVLESPFNNIYDAAMEHPFAKIFKYLWWFDDLFLEAMHSYGIYLQSDEHICHIELPILILHAEDDFVVPYALGVKLYEASKKRPKSFPPVTFHGFPYHRGLLHKWIFSAPELPEIISKFIKEIK